MVKAVLIIVSTQEIIKKGNYPSLEIIPITLYDDNGNVTADLKWLIVNEIAKPSFNPALEKLTRFEEITTDAHPLYPLLNQYRISYTITALTAQEQANYIQQQEDDDQYGQKTQLRRSDGDRMIERFFAYITRQNGEGNLSNPNAITSVTLIWDALLPLSYGQIEFTKIKLNAIDQTGLNQPVKDIINLAIQKVQSYLDNE